MSKALAKKNHGTSGKVLETYHANSLPSLMAHQHPIHGLFGAAFEEMGGHERLKKWAEDHYGDFIRIFAKMVPPPQPGKGEAQGPVELHPALKRTVLDGEKE